MNEQTKEILTWVGSFCVVGYWAFAIYRMQKVKKLKDAIPEMSEKELIRFFEEKSVVLSCGVLPELEKRKRNIDFALPKLIDAATDHNIAVRIIGWSSIETHFPEIKESMNYNPTRPSKKDKKTLRALKNVHIKSSLTTPGAAAPSA